MAGNAGRSLKFLAVFLSLLLPSAAYGQAAITGVVRDTSGGVLPGVTVEATSPVLIEKVRTVVTDGTGQYRIVDLRPGTYSVTFTLPGFNTVRRDGVELTGSFVATINADMRVGALEETITVTGETPIVDVQSARVETTLSKDVLASIPSSRNAAGIQSLIPGMSNTTDSGGIRGTMTGGAGSIHGGRGDDSRTYNDGINTGWGGGSAGGGNTPNVSGAQEVVLTTSGGMAEAETSGVILNVIPREGGNTFSGQFNASFSNGGLQGSNYTQSLKDQGLRAPSELRHVYDINPMGGGRIIRDRLWFYLTYREVGGENSVPGMFVNRNAGNPNAWLPDFDLSRQAFDDTLERNGIARLTWQATPRNKFNFHWSEQYTSSHTEGGGTATQTIEATGRVLYQPSHIQQVSYSSPISSRLLLEAGWGTYQARYRNPMPRVDGTHHPNLIRVRDQGGIIPNLLYRLGANRTAQGFEMHLIGALAKTKASLSYITGSHNVKFGYQGAFDNPSSDFYYMNHFALFRFRDGVPNQLTQTIAYPGNYKFVRNVIPTSFYAQDQWTTNRLTLQGGVRYDHLTTNYPDSKIGGPGYSFAPVEIFYPARSTPGISWDDISPRIGAAYDLFGTGKTAVKVNVGQYMEAYTGTSNSDMDLNPIYRTTVSTTRQWTDSNRDYVPNCDLANPERNGECGPMADKSLGKQTFYRFFDENFIHGWGVRPRNWGLGVSVQQELIPRVSVTVGYFRNWWGNWYAVDNRATSQADYTPFSVRAPLDPRLPNGGGYTVSGLYDLVPEKVGLIDELAQSASNFAEQTENWQGVDVNFSARFQNGLTLQGGTSTGRRLSDACPLKAVLPEQGFGIGSEGENFSIAGGSVTNPYCRVVEPYQTQIRGLATYTLPRLDVQISGTWSSNPGDELAANYVANNAVIAAGPQPLGRPLSGGSNVTVNLIEPGTLYADRINNVDLRIAKIFRYGRTRTQVGVDIYNLTNTDVPTGYNQTFVPGGSWLTPTAIQPARYARISAQVDF
jgi:hypothetical protein